MKNEINWTGLAINAFYNDIYIYTRTLVRIYSARYYAKIL